MNEDDSEPLVTLSTGRTVYYATYDLVKRLLDAGHDICVSAVGDVTVTPEVHSDVWHSLDACYSDVDAILFELQERDRLVTIH